METENPNFKKIKWQFWVLIILQIAILSCSTDTPPHQIGFYYWKTKLKLEQRELLWMDSLQCSTLFVKFLDVHRNPVNGLPEPSSMLTVQDTQFLAGKKIVPCIFITNSTFSALDSLQIDEFAQKTATLLLEIGNSFNQNPILQPQSEVQFDCDWTQNTRPAYFLFLKKIKKYLPATCQTTATVRLHQLKYPEKTGIPPVRRGMLMLYNTNDIEKMDTQNSILQLETVEKYLRNAPHYSLPLDVAVPAFSWTVVFRQGQFFKILPHRRARDFSDEKIFKMLPDGMWEVQSGTFIDGIFLRVGDRLRAELVPPETLRQITRRARTIANAPDSRLAIFHLDAAELSEYQPSDFNFGL